MKQLTIILLGLIGVAYGQSSPTSAKTRFVNGLYVGTKLDAYFNTADSNAIYWRADSALMAKYKGTARRVVFSGELGSYIPYSDTTSLLSQVVRTFGTQTVGGNKTFSNDLNINGITAGRGNGNSSTNTVFGSAALANASTMFSGTNSAFGILTLNALNIGTKNTAIGTQALSVADNAEENTAVGYLALAENTSGDKNIAIGNQAGYGGGGVGTTTGSNNIFIGYKTQGLTRTGTNELVLGNELTGNGSNTVTIGNSSVTGNYFSGDVNMTGNANGNEANFGFFGTPTPANSISASFANNSSTFEALQAKNNGSGKIAAFRNSGGIVAEFGNDGKIGVGATVDANFMVYALGAFPSRFTSTAATATSFYSGSRFERQAGANGDGNGISFLLYDNTSAFAEYGYMGSIIESNTSGSQSGAIVLAPSSGGSRTERFRAASNGDITALGVYNATVGGTNRDVFVDNTGLIGYVSSFRASKKNITPISNTDWLHKLNPVTFNYRVKDSTGKYTDSAYKELEYGLVAEEVESVNKEMVFYDVDTTGKQKLRGVHYSKLIIPLLAEVQEHKKRIDAQDKIIEALLTRIKALEAKLN